MFAFYPFHYIVEFCADFLGIYSYQNYIEISFFIFITYKSLTWLQQDYTKPLLLHSYVYLGLLITSYFSSCTILFHTLLFLAPALIIFCIIIHQRQLQKNFVFAPSKQLTPQTIPNKNWLEVLIRSCLQLSYKKQNIICIVQRLDHLESLLQAPYDLYVPIQQEIISLIITSSSLQNPTILWANSSGILCSINVNFNNNLTEEIFALNKHNSSIHLYESIALLTKKTDAFAFLIQAATNQHTLWYQGVILQKTTIDQLLKSCKEIMHHTDLSKENITIHHEKGALYDQKNSASHTTPPRH